MLTAIQFRQMVLRVSARYLQLERQFNWLQPYRVDHGYDLYCNSHNARLGFLVCGRTRINRSRNLNLHPPILGPGQTIENIDLYNLGATHHDPDAADTRASFTGPGSVLHYNSGWHFFMNDVWLLGGIHARRQFHIASPRHRNNIIDPIGGHLTVTGRELTGLREFGYAFGRDYYGQEIAFCAYPQRAGAADLTQYWAAIDRQGNGRTVDPALIDPTAVLANPTAAEAQRWELRVPHGPQTRLAS